MIYIKKRKIFLANTSVLIVMFLALISIQCKNTAGISTNDKNSVLSFSGTNKITIENNSYKITALQNSYATIRQPLNKDNLFVSAQIKSAGGTQWAPGIALYWDNNNWIRLVLAENIGFYAYEMIDGVLSQYNLSTYKGNEYNSVKISDLWKYDQRIGNLKLYPLKVDNYGWHYMGFELKKESVVYLSSDDAESWTVQRLGQRTGILATAPKYMILGKGFADNKKYAGELLENDNVNKGSAEVSYIKNVKMVDRNRTTINLIAHNHGEDILGNKELSSGKDPSFESVSKYYPAMQYTREAVGVKDHPFEFSVVADGAVVNDKNMLFFTINGERFGNEPKFPDKKLYNGYLPYVVANWKYDGLEVQQSILAWSKNMSVDESLYGYIKLGIKNKTEQNKKVSISYKGNGLQTEAQLNDIKTVIQPWEITLAPGEERDEFIKIPYQDMYGAARTTEGEYKKVADEYVNEWERILNAAMKIVTPEQRVNNAYKAWLAYNFINVDKVNGRYQIHDGNHFYEEIFGYSACLAIQALDWMGYGQDAEKYLESMLPLIDKNGLFVVNYGLPDQGALLTALADHYKMTGDNEWLKRVSPHIIKMCKWVVSERAAQKKTQDAQGKLFGLLKGRPYCDHPAPAYYYVSDMTITVGLEEASRALKNIGMESDAKWIMEEARDYRQCIMTSMKRAVIEHDGMKKLPLFPEDYKLLRAANFNAYDYYGLLVGTLIENNSLPVNSEYARMYVDLIEKKGGLLLGVARFWGGIDHAYSYGYWMHCMERGEIEKVLLGFYTSLAYGMTHDTYSAVEVTFIEEGKNFNTLPHTYSNTQQLRLLRNMLLREDAEGTTLRIGQGIPKHWLEDGKQVQVQDAPTLYGNVSYTMKSNINDDKINIDLYPGSKRVAEKTIIYFRHPKNKKLKNISLSNQVAYSIEGNAVILEKVSSPVMIQAGF